MVELSGFPTKRIIPRELKSDLDLFPYSVEQRLKFVVTFNLNCDRSESGYLRIDFK
jgi:hypothetical protein